MACRSCKTALEILPRRTPAPRISSTTTSSAGVFSSPRLTRITAQTRVRSQSQSQSSSRSFHVATARRNNAPTTNTNSTKGEGEQQQQRQQQQQQEPEEEKLTFAQRLARPLARQIARVARRTTEQYTQFGATERIYKVCAAQADYAISEADRKADRIEMTDEGEEIGTGGGMWHDDFHLLPTFSTWAQVTMLHMYLMVVRLRCLDREAARTWQTVLVDHFFHEAEAKMDTTHNIGSAALRQRYLQDLFVQWRGLLLAYDEGVARGDAVLASALWRNLYKARPDVDVRLLAALVSWMRLTLKNLDQMEDDALVVYGPSVFKWPAKSELVLVDVPSPALRALPEVAAAIAAGRGKTTGSSDGAQTVVEGEAGEKKVEA